ncbi:hypothetical protein B0H11DRAFT_1946341 [Mycena galericulata]|nr:hypothetical protein B0H11DRAFT_1946341 [Mycena galericulata]
MCIVAYSSVAADAWDCAAAAPLHATMSSSAPGKAPAPVYVLQRSRERVELLPCGVFETARDLHIACLRQVEVGGPEDGDATLDRVQHGSELWWRNSGTARSQAPQPKGCRAGQWRTRAAEKCDVVASSDSHSAFRMVRAARSGVVGRTTRKKKKKKKQQIYVQLENGDGGWERRGGENRGRGTRMSGDEKPSGTSTWMRRAQKREGWASGDLLAKPGSGNAVTSIYVEFISNNLEADPGTYRRAHPCRARIEMGQVQGPVELEASRCRAKQTHGPSESHHVQHFDRKDGTSRCKKRPFQSDAAVCTQPTSGAGRDVGFQLEDILTAA